ncbi:hypothetical protein O181_028409 [Austropuccinia psidii MF-1]|uniref:Uncharacterized protein n=1 Tax=Austropuccinia psidii MF-1 TaxID=1389203 RepID=A0A9Q3H3J9_9BASI|nr:hypothetical protein [Austropuccinia psidii MF-1]
MLWFIKQKDRLIALHPDMSEAMVHKRILTKFGGDLEHAIRSRCIDSFSTKYLINVIEDIITRKKIGRNCDKTPIESKTISKPILRERPNKPKDMAPLQSHEFGSNAHLANMFPKQTRINKI